MADLRTRYLGMELRSPLVASSSPLTGSLDGLRRLEAAGAGAVTLPSLFEEELSEDAGRPDAYLSLVAETRKNLEIPVVASLNGVSRGGWASYATRLEEAGASALELNVYYVSSRPGLSGSDVEWHYLDVVRAVRQATRLPLAIKLSPYFSAMANMAGQLVEAGADGLILFNRFYQPDLDVEAMTVLPALELSSSVELRLPLRWIAILHRRHRVSLAASTGVHTAVDVLKVLLAGADVAMMTSALLRNGPDHLRPLETQVRDWMDRHGFDTLEQLLGTVGEARTGAVVLLAADMPAEHALRRLDQQAVSGAPVVDRGRVVGVITRRDLLVPIPEQGSYESPWPPPWPPGGNLSPSLERVLPDVMEVVVRVACEV